MTDNRKEHTMHYILLTGGVASGIGKGTLAAMLGRQIARSGRSVTYQKLEPCLQTSIGGLSNRIIGEIVLDQHGNPFDGDVARASFYIPGFEPQCQADLPLGLALAGQLSTGEAERLATGRLDEIDRAYAQVFGRAERYDHCIVEVGGTAGEPEHRLVLEALRRTLGEPYRHVHLTTTVEVAGRRSTKPAQQCLYAVEPNPDIIVWRDPRVPFEELTERLAPVVGRTLPMLIADTDDRWPERAYYRLLVGEWAGLPNWSDILTAEPDPLFESTSQATFEPRIYIEHDGAGPDGYGSLARRLRCWSGGRAQLYWDERPAPQSTAVSFDGVVRIGESALAGNDMNYDVPTLDLRSRMSDAPRRWNCRPDWWGNAEEPDNLLAQFIDQATSHARHRVAASPHVEVATPIAPDEDITLAAGENAYHSEAFADIYVAESRDGELRDHSVLDELIWRCLPGEEHLNEARILDVGCGDGRWSSRLVERGVGQVTGIEPAAPMAARARQRGLERFELVEGPIEDAPLDDVFDFVLASMSLDHVAAIGPALDRLADHMQPGARLVVTTEHPLRTAPTDNVRWLDEEDGARASRVRDYGKSGWRTFHWFDRPEPVRVYHRPAGQWLAYAQQAGLDLVAMHEPVTDTPRDGHNPRFWMLVFERPTHRRRIVTIDGPAGAGKTTLGRALADMLDWRFVDTGPMNNDRLDTIIDDADDGLILAGRSLGRYIQQPLLRLWLDCPVDVRAQRRGVVAEQLSARDARDRQRCRLVAPDIAAVSFDTSQFDATTLALRAQRLVRGQLRRWK